MIACKFAGYFGVLSSRWGEKMEDENQNKDCRKVCRMLLRERMMGKRNEWRMLIKMMVYMGKTGDFW